MTALHEENVVEVYDIKICAHYYRIDDLIKKHAIAF